MQTAHAANGSPRPYESLPSPKGLPLAGHWPEVVNEPFRFLEDSARLADVVRLRFGPLRALLVNDPRVVQHVLQNSPKVYTKSRNYAAMKRVLGEGLLTSEGDFWRRQRKLAQPAFQHARLHGFVDTMTRATSEMLARLETREDGHELDLHAEMMRVTLRMAGMTLFGADLDDVAVDVARALAIVLPWVNASIERPFRAPLWVPTRENREFQRAMRTLDGLVARVVSARRASGREHADLLGLLMAARDDEGSGAMSDRQLRDEVLTAVLAGHETTANALTWAWYLLAQHPEWLERVRDEARRVLGERDPAFLDLAKLEVTERVLEESMRLYPPAWEFEREALVDDVAHGICIPKGTIVMIAPYTMHRHARYWDEPQRFDPDRFLPDRVAARPRYVYLPFGDGPRVCIGKGFAMMEAKILLAMMARTLSFTLAAGQRVELDPSITLRPVGGLRVRCSRAAFSAPCAT